MSRNALRAVFALFLFVGAIFAVYTGWLMVGAIDDMSQQELVEVSELPNVLAELSSSLAGVEEGKVVVGLDTREIALVLEERDRQRHLQLMAMFKLLLLALAVFVAILLGATAIICFIPRNDAAAEPMVLGTPMRQTTDARREPAVPSKRVPASEPADTGAASQDGASENSPRREGDADNTSEAEPDPQGADVPSAEEAGGDTSASEAKDGGSAAESPQSKAAAETNQGEGASGEDPPANGAAPSKGSTRKKASKAAANGGSDPLPGSPVQKVPALDKNRDDREGPQSDAERELQEAESDLQEKKAAYQELNSRWVQKRDEEQTPAKQRKCDASNRLTQMLHENKEASARGSTAPHPEHELTVVKQDISTATILVDRFTQERADINKERQAAKTAWEAAQARVEALTPPKTKPERKASRRAGRQSAAA